MTSTTYQVHNMKCTGCTTRIKDKVSLIRGITNVSVDLDNDALTFNYDSESALTAVGDALRAMGYPMSDEPNTFGDVTKSYVNCMIGKVKNKL